MKKVVRWEAPKIASGKLIKGGYRSFHDMFKKAIEREDEQREAQMYLQKAMPAMLALLEYKLAHAEPLLVMRPLVYMTSELGKSEDDDGFYSTRHVDEKQSVGKFVDVRKTITPGTQLMLKSLDMSLNEYVFQDARGKEHAISFEDRNLLMTQTSIFEEVKQFLANRGEVK